MMNCFIPLCIIALVATIQAWPTRYDYNSNNNHINNNNTSSIDSDENKNLFGENDLQDDQYQYRSKASRHLKQIIDGTVHRIKAAGAIYRQRLHDDQCVVEYDGQYLTENSVIQIRKKLYRVENCLLDRVFHACGPNLLLMLNVVCRVVEQQPTTTPITPTRRQTTPSPPIPPFLHHLYTRSNKTPRVITESCCENLCTISELSRYCHR